MKRLNNWFITMDNEELVVILYYVETDDKAPSSLKYPTYKIPVKDLMKEYKCIDIEELIEILNNKQKKEW